MGGERELSWCQGAGAWSLEYLVRGFLLDLSDRVLRKISSHDCLV